MEGKALQAHAKAVRQRHEQLRATMAAAQGVAGGEAGEAGRGLCVGGQGKDYGSVLTEQRKTDRQESWPQAHASCSSAWLTPGFPPHVGRAHVTCLKGGLLVKLQTPLPPA